MNSWELDKACEQIRLNVAAHSRCATAGMGCPWPAIGALLDERERTHKALRAEILGSWYWYRDYGKQVDEERPSVRRATLERLSYWHQRLRGLLKVRRAMLGRPPR